MVSNGEIAARIVGSGAATGIVAGLAFVVISILHLLTINPQFEPSSNLLKNATTTFFPFIFWALAFFQLLATLVFLGLRQLLSRTRSDYGQLATVLGIVSFVMFALSSIVYATTMPSLAAAYASGADSDLQRAILFQASAFDDLAQGIIAIASAFFAVSVLLWSRAMDSQFGKYSLFTLALGVYSLLSLLPFWPGSILPFVSLLIFTGVWLTLLGLKMVMMTSKR